MSVCFFVGNNGNAEALFPVLLKAVERHIREYGVREFIVCSQNEFDRLAIKAVITAKRKNPNVVLSMLSITEVSEVPDGIEKLYYPDYESILPKWFAVVKAKRNIIDNAHSMIIYDWQSAKSTRELVEYARKRENQGKMRIEEIFAE